MKELRIEHKKNEHLIFGKTNPIRADEGASRPLHLGAPGADGLSKVFLNTNLNGQATGGGTIADRPRNPAKQQLAEQNRKIARLEEQLAAAQNDASLFDLRRDSADHIIRVMTDPSTISEHKARTIATGILAGLKARSKPAG